MKVNAGTTSRATTGSSSAGKTMNGASSLFTRKLEQVGQQQMETERRDLELLKEQLIEIGDELEKNQTMANFHTFRSVLASFAKKAASVAYRVKASPSAGGLWSHDILSVIDKEADELYHLVMGGQKNRIKIASKLVQIKGLLIDLTI